MEHEGNKKKGIYKFFFLNFFSKLSFANLHFFGVLAT